MEVEFWCNKWKNVPRKEIISILRTKIKQGGFIKALISQEKAACQVKIVTKATEFMD